MSTRFSKVFTQTLPSGISFDMVLVEPGSFLMGSEDKEAYDDEQPVHEVKIAYPFYMGKFPVTQELYKAVMDGQNPSYFVGDNRPVEQVSWYDAVVFINRLNELSGYPPACFSDREYKKPFGKIGDEYRLTNEGEVYLNPNMQGYRLPSEAEWEFAARGGNHSGNYKYAGGSKLTDVGWYGDNSHRETKPVGLKLPNEQGIYDMSGNVWEWCEDKWHSDYQGAPNDGSAWLSKEGGKRVQRGGGWIGSAQGCRVPYRDYSPPAYRDDLIGFRLVLVSLRVKHPVS